MMTDLVKIPDDGQGRRAWWERFRPPSYQQQPSKGQEPDRKGEESSLGEHEKRFVLGPERR